MLSHGCSVPPPSLGVYPTPASRRTAIWLMTGDRPGDNAQVTAIAQATGLPFDLRPIVPIGGSRGHKAPRNFSAAKLDADRSALLAPPWPDLIVTIGQWGAAAALWVQERSGCQTKVVLIGRPKPSELDRFALVVVSSQYSVPARPTVVRLSFPALDPDRERIEEAAAKWGPYLHTLPRPLTAICVGGATKPFRFDGAVARRLAEEIGDLLWRAGGSAYVVTSPRTDPRVTAALGRHLPRGTRLFDWHQDDKADNPYLGLLATADRFVVTGDSISMMIEVARLGRPLAIFALPKERRLGARLGLAAHRRLATRRSDPLGVAARLAHRLGILHFPRDLEAVHRRLYARGVAVP
jgi:mitochondrial fission protein ELM1